MSGQWKPGDVATTSDNGFVTFFQNEGTTELMFTNSHGYQHPARHLSKNARPLVVIDPEDAGEVDRIATNDLRLGIESVLRISIDDRQWERISERVQAALRSLIAPPKPDEPTGLGAVVEDAEGRRWCLCAPQDAARWMHDTTGPVIWREYADINTVRVLSPGVDA